LYSVESSQSTHWLENVVRGMIFYFRHLSCLRILGIQTNDDLILDVHGIMDGEVISMRSAGELSEQEFILI
jgi:hypothetical protein